MTPDFAPGRELTEHERRSAAWHAAGHVVATIVLGAPIGIPLHRAVVLKALDDRMLGGFVEHVPDYQARKPRTSPMEIPPKDRRYFAEYLRIVGVIAYAGAAAQFPSDGQGWWSHAEASQCRDDRSGFVAAAAHVGWIRSDYCTSTLRRARLFVDQHWGAVLAVARELYDHSELSGIELREIVERAEPAWNWMRPTGSDREGPTCWA